MKSNRSTELVYQRPMMRLLMALGLVAGVIGTAPIATAADLTWGGTYRVEMVKIKDPELASEGAGGDSNKAYILNHVVLTPKIVAADGLTIFSRLDILNHATYGISPAGTVYSVAGDFLGRGPNPTNTQTSPSNTSPSTSGSGSDANAWAHTQLAGNLAITTLYASWVQEFGQLVVGRMPMQFGLGTAFNAGGGLFDHYIDTKDAIAYKVVFGNLFVMPMLAKVNEGLPGDEDDVNDYIMQVGYENPETELSIGAIYQMRIGTFGGNDTPVNGPVGGTANSPAVVADGFKNTLIGLFSKQKVGNFRIGLEADLQSGDTGMHTADGRGVSMNGFGIAGEFSYHAPDSKLSAMLKAGMASGDDPGTQDSYEGFAFNRNYDVALLLFNHPLGQADILRTGLVRPVPSGTPPNITNPVRNQLDSEAISNAIYIAPSLQYQMRDNLGFAGSFVYGILNKDPIGNGANTGSNLGYELDLSVTYKPLERLTWITEAGALLPGDAWKAGSTNNFENKFAYGLVTKAAISF